MVVDTCIFIEFFLKNPAAEQWLKDNRPSTLLVPAVVVMESFKRTPKSEERRRAAKLFSRYSVVIPTSHDWNRAKRSFELWNPQHRRPGVVDMLIGQIAVSKNMPVVTLNVKDFEHIDQLSVHKPF